jgi:glucose-1-phosphate cytidylyltransferase
MKAVILAGGLGTRLREETEFRPKPMVEIGGKPIIWHIMKTLSVQGINEFVICLGYKGDYIKDYFMNYEARVHDITVKLGTNEGTFHHTKKQNENWMITLADTGLTTMTGGRIAKIRQYLGNEDFLCTYGDGVADINLEELRKFHSDHGKIATVTAVRPTNRFGAMKIDENETVTDFSEKPISEKWVNGGFFIFKHEVFDFIEADSILEKEPLERLASLGQLKSYKHKGFWQPMDTYRETQELNLLWEQNRAPWKIW